MFRLNKVKYNIMKTTEEILKEIDRKVIEHETIAEEFKNNLDLENAIVHQQLVIELLALKTFILS